MNLENVTREDWIVGGLALLLAICLIVLPWFDISVTVGAFSASASYSATSTPDGWLGILAFIAALAIVADLALERLSPQTQIPAIGGSRTNTRFVLALVTAAFVILKFLFHIHFSLFGWGFYVDIILTAALVWVAYQARAGAPIGFPSGGGRASSRPTPPPSAGTGAGPSGPAHRRRASRRRVEVRRRPRARGPDAALATYGAVWSSTRAGSEKVNGLWAPAASCCWRPCFC